MSPLHLLKAGVNLSPRKRGAGVQSDKNWIPAFAGMTNTVSVVLRFTFLLTAFRRGQKKQPPIIGATCAFDAKIYKNVDGIFNVSSCG